MDNTYDIIKCRIKREHFPKLDEIVVTKVVRISENGIYVSLIEYDNIEGLVLSSEISRRPNVSTKIYCIGQQINALVLRIDADKGYIDLSFKKVSPSQSEECCKKFTMTKIAFNIFKQLSIMHDKEVESYYTSIVWDVRDKFGHEYNLFKLMLSEREKILEQIDLSDDEKKNLYNLVIKKMRAKILWARADIELMCMSAGIDGIKDILTTGQICDDSPTQFGLESCQVIIKYVGAPIYALFTNSYDKKCAIDAINKSISIMENVAHKYDAILNVVKRPHIMGDNECDDIDDKINDYDSVDNFDSDCDDE